MKLKTIRPQHLENKEIGPISDPEVIDELVQPYYKTIERLKLIMKLECPLTKLDVIFRIFTEILPNELRDFWLEGNFLCDKDLYIDYKDLRMLMVYILIQTQCSKLKTDLDIIQEFIPQVLKFTNRSFYIALLQSAFDFIDHMTECRLKELTIECCSEQALTRLKSFEQKAKEFESYESKHLRVLSSQSCAIVDKLLEVESEAQFHLKVQQK